MEQTLREGATERCREHTGCFPYNLISATETARTECAMALLQQEQKIGPQADLLPSPTWQGPSAASLERAALVSMHHLKTSH